MDGHGIGIGIGSCEVASTPGENGVLAMGKGAAHRSLRGMKKSMWTVIVWHGSRGAFFFLGGGGFSSGEGPFACASLVDCGSA